MYPSPSCRSRADRHLRRSADLDRFEHRSVRATASDGETQRSDLSELGAEMALDRSTLGRNVLVLQRMGLLDISKEEDDLRARRLTLTDRAQRLVDSCLPLWEAAQRQVERRLGKHGVAILLELLERLETSP